MKCAINVLQTVETESSDVTSLVPWLGGCPPQAPERTHRNKSGDNRDELVADLLNSVRISSMEFDGKLESIQATCRLSLKMGREDEQKPLMHWLRR